MKENINNYTEDNESIKNSEKSILSQLKEWEIRFDDLWGKYADSSYRDESLCTAKEMMSFIKTEIRKAEEKSYNQAITDIKKLIPNDPEAESGRWNFASIGVNNIQDYQIGFKEGFNCWKNEFINALEAFKK